MVEVALVALYLRGFGAGCPRRRWPLVVGALRSAACSLAGAAEALRLAGLNEEAHALSDLVRLNRAENLLMEGRVLTFFCEGYPVRWQAALGAAAPPALWACGALSSKSQPYLGVVGSREPAEEVPPVVTEVVDCVTLAGYSIISGGARGVDRLASVSAASQGSCCLELLPVARSTVYGKGPAATEGAPSTWLSLNPVGTPVGAASLMERNVLIYAASDATAVFQPRFRSGGTWHGASEALRKRLCPVLVHRGVGELDGQNPDDRDLAVRALIALGAAGFSGGEDIPQLLARHGTQPVLPLAEPW